MVSATLQSHHRWASSWIATRHVNLSGSAKLNLLGPQVPRGPQTLLCRPHYRSEGMTDGRFHAAACSSDPHESIEDALILSHDHHLLASIKVQESLSGRFGIY